MADRYVIIMDAGIGGECADSIKTFVVGKGVDAAMVLSLREGFAAKRSPRVKLRVLAHGLSCPFDNDHHMGGFGLKFGDKEYSMGDAQTLFATVRGAFEEIVFCSCGLASDRASFRAPGPTGARGVDHPFQSRSARAELGTQGDIPATTQVFPLGSFRSCP